MRQFERRGLLFSLLYGAKTIFRWLRRDEPYVDNRFERSANAAARLAQPH